LTASSADRLQTITDDLRERLGILEMVHVTLVEHNPLVMSVETTAGRSGPFVMTVDDEFIHTLSEDELKAALAHELGHVWLYTHHPYQQTEWLANHVAMRVISRSVLEPVYEKVWRRTGMRGNLAEYLNATLPGGSQ
jgi:Zn-dependent protease with chaperone function